jgi:hypothetical protein
MFGFFGYFFSSFLGLIDFSVFLLTPTISAGLALLQRHSESPKSHDEMVAEKRYGRLFLSINLLKLHILYL